MDNCAEAVWVEPALSLNKQLGALPRDPYLGRKNSQLLQYVDVFVDDFLGLAQGPRHRRRHVCRTLFHALEKVSALLTLKIMRSGTKSCPSKS